MVIKVDLQCCRCYKKIKKILCQLPQIRDQIYNEKQNMMLITVMCCSPEKIRQMIICKGGQTVQSVEILLDKPMEPEQPKKPKDTKKPEVVEPPKETPKLPAPAPGPAPPPKQKPLPPKAPIPMVGYPPVLVYRMVGVCCCPPGYGGYGGGPCYFGWRRPVMCFDGCGRPAHECQGGNRGSFHGPGRLVLCDDGCGRPAGECQGGTRGFYLGLGRPVMCDDGCGRLACECRRGNRGYYVSRCDCFSEENATGCTIM